MTNIVNSNYAPFYNEDGLELVINTETGECFASQRALARMVDKSESTIRTYLSARKIEGKEAQIQTPKGIQGARLLDENTIYEVFQKYKPELLIACAKAGIRMYLHTLAGYKFEKVHKSKKEMTQGEFLMMAGKALYEMEQKQKLLEQKLVLEAQRTDDLEKIVEHHDAELDRIFNPTRFNSFFRQPQERHLPLST